MRKICLVLLICLALVSSAAYAGGADENGKSDEKNNESVVVIENEMIRGKEKKSRPLVIAVAPLIDKTGGWMDREIAGSLMSRIYDELHVPLNDTMNWVEFKNEGDAQNALSESLKRQGKKSKMTLVMRDMAESMNVDIALCLVVDACYQRTFMGFGLERGLMVESVASLTLYGYDRKNDRPIKESASRWERDEYGPAHDIDVMIMDALDEALRDADIKSIIFPIKKMYVK